VNADERGSVQPIGWILWAGTVGLDGPLSDRFAAAAATGYQRVSLSPPDVLRAAEAGVTAADIGRRARELGLELVVDPVMNWYPDAAPSPSRFAGVSSGDALRMCEGLGAVSLSAIGTATSDVPVPELAGHFARLCDRAADFGAQVHLEFMPFTVVRTLRIAWDLVRAADRENGGLVFDTWHFFRGDPDFDLLATVPGERIFCVQFDDAAAVPQGSLREETARRLLPGDGAFDLARVVRVLHAIGALRWVGPEVINPELAELPALEGAQLARDRVRALLEATVGPL
jgi:sugar phosphate isomerase/epimerase